MGEDQGGRPWEGKGGRSEDRGGLAAIHRERVALPVSFREGGGGGEAVGESVLRDKLYAQVTVKLLGPRAETPHGL